MTLQRRLALTLALSAIPLVGALAWVRTEIARRADVQVLRDIVLTRAAALGRERCEAAPAHLFDWPSAPDRAGPDLLRRRPRLEGGGEGFRLPILPPGARTRGAGFPFRPLQAFTYDAEFRPQSPSAPAFPSDLREALAGGRESASRRIGLEPPADSPPSAASPPAEELPREPASLEVLELGVRTGWTDGPCAFVLARRIGPVAPAPVWDLLAHLTPILAGLIAAVWIASGPLVRRVQGLTAAVRRSADALYAVSVPEQGSDEIAELARAFNQAGTAVRQHVATLERRERTLRAFLANTTHDVMIPLTVLQGHLSLMQTHATHGTPPDPAVVLASLKEAQYMASLVHNLAAVAKLDAPEEMVRRHVVDLNALVERVAERHRPVARAAGVDLEFAVPECTLTIGGDVTLLEQAVSNVVHNAVRYNRPGGHVGIVLDALDASDGSFRLRVVDDGPGVPEEVLPQLTERRFRGEDARQRDSNGLGLGLAIAQEVAERHDLELQIGRSEEGGLAVEFRTRGTEDRPPQSVTGP